MPIYSSCILMTTLRVTQKEWSYENWILGISIFLFTLFHRKQGPNSNDDLKRRDMTRL